MTSHSQSYHKAHRARLFGLALIVAFLSTLLWSNQLFAQTPRAFRIPPFDLPDVESSEAEAATLPEAAPTKRHVIVDTDPGIDDAVALVWLLSQNRYRVEVEGIVTVTGNTTAEQGVNNVREILGWFAPASDITSIPVIQGAAAPLAVPQSLTPWLIHGPTGLWTVVAEPATPDSTDATAFYCEQLAQQPGLLVIALGPLTNLARAMDPDQGGCPALWAGVEIVSLGGGIDQSNQTPVTEYNYWQDPDAANFVVSNAQANGAILHIVVTDAFNQLEISTKDLRTLERPRHYAIQNLLEPLGIYIAALSQGGNKAALPDPVAMIYALERRVATEQSALVKVLTGAGVPEIVRGQTVVGLSVEERITMIADDATLSNIAFLSFTDPNFDINLAIFELLTSMPDNATVVTDIDAKRVHNLFMQGVKGRRIKAAAAKDAGVEQGEFEFRLFVPNIRD